MCLQSNWQADANSYAELPYFLDLVNIKPKVMSFDLIWIQHGAFPLRSAPLNINSDVQRELHIWFLAGQQKAEDP